MRVWVRICVVAFAVTAVAAGSAFAAVPAGTPDPSAIVLTAADFPGAAKDLQKQELPASSTFVAGYENSLGFTKPYGASKYRALISLALVNSSASVAATTYGLLVKQYSGKAQQTALIKEFVTIKKTTKVKIVKSRALGVRDSSTEIGAIVTTPKKPSLNLSIEVFRLDRIVVLDVFAGAGKTVVIADAKKLTAIVAAHAKAALAPIDTALPVVTGTPQQGQTLSSDIGTWGNTPTAYAYQWQSCDATGGTCADIPAATASTYVVQPTDVGKTLRVTVTATNAFGSAAVESAVTAPAS